MLTYAAARPVAKYERLGGVPSALQQRRNYRTRPDTFVEHWSQVETMLATSPELEAKALFGWLCEQYPGHYQEGQVRTFQRRVNEWGSVGDKVIIFCYSYLEDAKAKEIKPKIIFLDAKNRITEKKK